MTRVKKLWLSPRVSKPPRRRLIASLTLLEIMIVVCLLAGLSTAVTLPVWKGWKTIQMTQQEKQLRSFFKELSTLMVLTQSEIKLQLRQSEGREQLVASGYFFEAKSSQLSIVLDSGLHLHAKGLSKQPASWVLSPLAQKQEVLLRIEDNAGHSKQWKETLCLWEGR